jgi:hypothetical protein
MGRLVVGVHNELGWLDKQFVVGMINRDDQEFAKAWMSVPMCWHFEDS